MVNLIMRLMGLGKAVDALDGATSKAYIGGVGQMLSGAGAVLIASGNILAEIVPLHGADAYLHFAQGLSHDPNVAAILAGIGLFHMGLAIIGNRHATAVLANTISAQAQSPVPAPEQPAALPPTANAPAA